MNYKKGGAKRLPKRWIKFYVRLDTEANFCLRDNLHKGMLIEHSNICEHLAVNANRGFLESVHEDAVA